MQSPPNHSPQGPFDVAEKGVDRTDDDRPVFKTEHYDKLEKPGAIRILNVFPGHPEDLEVHCELILGTILDSKQRLEHNPPIKFVPYDALSWCWGIQNEESWINIRKGGTRYAKAVRSDLVAALRALRHHEHDRRLWIDAVCIDEDNVTERNRQVEMMADIYGNADCVRIWLGNPSESSRIAIRFIKKEVLQLQHFDELCESEKATEKWKSLLELMQRPWFSRRWVVQEVALARKAIIHCGSAKIAWNKFAVAVELFVEVETATHRLSEVMKKDPKYYHVPMWFEYVSALGASLLVRATSELFRDYQHSSKASEGKKKPAVKKKSSPEPDEVDIESEDDEVVSPRERALQYERDSLENGVVPKAQPLLDLEYLVCSLSIFNVLKPHDTIYALLGIAKDTSPTAANQEFRVSDHTERALEMFMEKKRYTVSYEAPYVDVCKEFIQFCIERALHIDPSRALDVICRPWAAELSLSAKSADEMSMPSWIPQLSKASYGMDTKPGVEGMKMGRKNADPLVGLPTLTHRNYKAAETKGLDMKSFRTRLKNESRTQLKYFSMYVKGFILDEIQDVQPSSQNGSIPSEWAEFAGWRNTQGDPPDRFWRTLVADRGRDGKNPPVYYSRACKESFNKGSFQSGTVDTNGLISNERNSVVAQFCRRVQAAIWNRALVRTKHGKLGLVSKNVQAGDLVCILYGCSVPVILRKNGPKNPGVLDIEMEWELKYLAERAAGYYSNHLVKREKFRSKRMEDDEHYMKWERAKREMWKGDKRWAD
ncbi:HET-domain-containing protein, partial [Viridothelium virens]